MGTNTITLPKRTITLEGLPEEMAQAFELMIEGYKKYTATVKSAKNGRIEFAVWPGTIRGTLTRREIYDYL